MNAITMDRVGVQLGGRDVVRDVSAAVPRGSVTAIIGPNGAGKTSLLRAILGLLPHTGVIRFPTETGSKESPPRMGYVPQRLDFDRGMPMTVAELLAMDAQRSPIWLGTGKAAIEKARAGLRRVEAEKLLHQQIGKLSGGELQRVQLALALQLEPEILLLDEPVSGVDIVGEHLFCDLLQSVQEESALTLVMVSHDLSVVSKHATHVLCLNQTLVASGPVLTVLTNDILGQAFGSHMLFGDLPGLAVHHHCHDHGPKQ